MTRVTIALPVVQKKLFGAGIDRLQPVVSGDCLNRWFLPRTIHKPALNHHGYSEPALTAFLVSTVREKCLVESSAHQNVSCNRSSSSSSLRYKALTYKF